MMSFGKGWISLEIGDVPRVAQTSLPTNPSRMQRRGSDGEGGLVFVLNNNGVEWRGNPVQTAFPNAHFQPVAFRGSSDTGVPANEATNHDGWGDFWAPPRGYTVYARTP